MPLCLRLNIESRSRFIVDWTPDQALVPPSTVRFAPLMNDDSEPESWARSRNFGPGS